MTDFPDYEAMASWVYKFTSPHGVVPWQELPKHRRDTFVASMKKPLALAIGDDRLFTMVLSPGDPWTVDQHIESYAKSYYYNLNIRQAWPKEATDADA